MTALIPPGNFSFLPYGVFDDLHNITIILDGTLNLWEGNISEWTKVPQKFYYGKSGSQMNAITFFNSTWVTMTSTNKNGTIIGNGWRWWVTFVVTDGSLDRPMILLMVNCNHTIVEGWLVHDSPFAFLFFDTMYHALFQNIRIHADWESQAVLLKAHDKLSENGIPFFPINTGGIQVSGVNVTARNCYIEMFDDAFAVKPRTEKQGCTRDMVFEDTEIVQGLGASIGSMAANRDVDCIRNITFRRINFRYPIKAIYVKWQPCHDTESSGIIDDVTYEDIFADTPTTWGIYVGTQQQQEGNVSTGCSFFYPLPGTKCPVGPCVTVKNLKLRNVYMKNALLSPGMMRCNETNPCTGWEWTNVTMTSARDPPLPFGNNFLCNGIKDAKFVNVTQSCVANVSDGI